ncbi:lamin tail domain-containing protein [Candidatus Dojkabacteria bacterium]|nr:lamin tail domain-containing protein [Candidatus Dojkabacteria bacterium]
MKNKFDSKYELSDCLKISEVFAAPKEFDSNNDGHVNNSDEYIEIYNCGTTSVNLIGYLLDDITTGGSAPYTIPSNTLLDPGGYWVFYGNTTGIVLNNSNESVNLINNLGEIIDSITYSSSSYDISLAYLPQWDILINDIPTPGDSTTTPIHSNITELSDQLSTINGIITNIDTPYKGFALLQDELSVIRVRSELIPEDSLGKAFQLLGYFKARANYNEFTVLALRSIDYNPSFPLLEISSLSTELLNMTICLNGYASQIDENTIRLTDLQNNENHVTVHIPESITVSNNQIVNACGLLAYKYSKYQLYVTDPALVTTQVQGTLGSLVNTGINYIPLWITTLVLICGIFHILNRKKKCDIL